MCGRYASFRDAQDLSDYFALREIDEDAEAWAPSWNVAPTQQVRIVTLDDDGPRLRLARWGLVPSWAKDPSIGSRMINARAETLPDKPAFRAALAKRRCIVPADAYYEWRRDAKTKTPFAIGLADGGPFGFAGLHELWRGPDDGWLVSCTIITFAARERLRPLHDREPLILSAAAMPGWLDPESTGRDALVRALDGVAPVEAIAWHEVSTDVNSVAHNSPDLLRPVG